MKPKRTFLSIILAMAFILGGTSTASAAPAPQVSYADGLVNMRFDTAQSGRMQIGVYDGGALIFQSETPVSGTLGQVGLPIRHLQVKNYVVAAIFYSSDGTSYNTSITVNAGVSSPIDYAYTNAGTNNPSISRAIMQPYAKVYGNSSMSGAPIVELKRFDFVRVIEDNGTVAKVKYFIQSGNGSFEYRKNGFGGVDGIQYTSRDDITGTGYIYTSAFNMPLTSQSNDIVRSAVELAYSRQGAKGIYNQASRYEDFYTDCSAFVSYCYYNVGINIEGAYGTTCNGIANWANAHPNTIVWEATKEDSATILSFLDSHNTRSHDDPNHGVGPPNIELHNSKGESVNADTLMRYTTKMTSSDIRLVQPGDILFFNHQTTIFDQYNCNLGKWSMIEYYEGVDHVGIVVGARGDTISYLEANPDASNPKRGVYLSTKTLSELSTVVKIVRPGNAA